MNLIYFITIAAGLLGINEYLKRKFLVPSYISRKIAHLGSAVIGFFTPYYLDRFQILVLCLVFILCLFYTRRTNILSSIQKIDRKTWGEIFLPLGIAVSALIFLPSEKSAFQFGILVMGFSDGIAGLLGESFGRHFLISKYRKSTEGTVAFFLISLTLILIFARNFNLETVFVALVLTLAEFLLSRGLDNVILPVLSSYLFLILLR